MTVVTYAQGDNFIFRIFKRAVGDNSIKWSNTYEVTARAAGSTTDLEALVAKLISMERTIHYNTVQVYRTSVSTWVPDSHPYNPLEFLTNEADFGVGLRTPSQILPLEVCWHVARDAKVGRPGKIFYRGAVDGTEVQASGRAYSFVDEEAMQDVIDAAVTNAILGQYFSGGTAPLGFVMIGIPKGETVPYNIGIQTFASKGVSIVQMKHGWYNRAEQPAP